MLSTFASTDLILVTLAYLLGSISSAILFGRLLGFGDPRLQGSGNPGATNMLRTGSRLAAILTLFGDTLKGYLPVLLAIQLSLSPLSIGLVGLAAFIGHLFPVFFQFRGGKGVATALGVFLGFDLLLGIIQLLCWLTVLAIFRISSLAAIATALITPVLCYWLLPDYLSVCGFICLLLIFRHRTNLISLVKGTEHQL
ncbi:glycerol-3-phosphate 1-O-acyltransferase PlsY [Motiliproteus sp. MSK22-1]|uniref:glycerol-3-phosphate 1-O-acyltransferase PlsY n=1 Tax=Motiliproteus sp. MSK22-1 TaxID=1897630 RepID=UPI000977F7A3|nr:glycerol-3-phosphate 1-O-acyltransferase PlsY [Motiliproteus sp. MSK22-1]OMH32149.1 acyl-phosphate glycerol 3-phosphate acyltransferase [Motiliproteus sp. MSK22-1]